MLHIAVINESTAIADAAVESMIPAFDAQWNNDLNPVWGVGAATFAFNPKQAGSADRLVVGGISR